MTTAIDHFVERLALPEGGVDLKAELVALTRARVRQALEKKGGDLAAAARLLRMSRGELVRLEARITDGDSTLPAARAPGEPEVDVRTVSRIVGGVERISAAAIRRLAAEGHDDTEIVRRTGVNAFVVDKVLREMKSAEIVRLDRDEKLKPREIAARLKLPIQRVRAVLVAHDVAALARRANGEQNQ
jgi:hypothetical protein